MIELCRTTGQKLLFEGKYESAVPAALAALKFAIQVYGLSSIELVPSYLILGEASIGKNHFINFLVSRITTVNRFVGPKSSRFHRSFFVLRSKQIIPSK